MREGGRKEGGEEEGERGEGGGEEEGERGKEEGRKRATEREGGGKNVEVSMREKSCHKHQESALQLPPVCSPEEVGP